MYLTNLMKYFSISIFDPFDSNFSSLKLLKYRYQVLRHEKLEVISIENKFGANISLIHNI